MSRKRNLSWSGPIRETPIPQRGAMSSITLKPVDAHLAGLHLLGPPPEGHVGVAGAGSVPLLLLHHGQQAARLAHLPLAAPVVEHLLDQLVVLLQEQLRLGETHQLGRGRATKLEQFRQEFLS